MTTCTCKAHCCTCPDNDIRVAPFTFEQMLANVQATADKFLSVKEICGIPVAEIEEAFDEQKALERMHRDFEALQAKFATPEELQAHLKQEKARREQEQQQEKERQEQEQEDVYQDALAAAAERIAEAREDFGAYPCSDSRRVLMHDDGRPTIVDEIELRCEKEWGCNCPGCKRFLIRREMIAARVHFEHATELFFLTIRRADWKAVQRRLQRAGGDFYKIRNNGVLSDDLTLIIDVPLDLPGIAPITSERALSILQERLDSWDGPCRPITTSRGWKLPRRKKVNRGRKVFGEIPSGIDDTCIGRVVDQHTATIHESTPPSGSGIHRWRSYIRRGGWSQSERWRLVIGLTIGEYVPPIDAEKTPYEDGERRTRRRRHNSRERDFASAP